LTVQRIRYSANVSRQLSFAPVPCTEPKWELHPSGNNEVGTTQSGSNVEF